jgi:glycosyltransferase involved in cell wall biosynthesis
VDAAVAALAAVAPDRPLILDGLVFGAIDTAGLARVAAPLVAMIHHPLAMETGLSPARRQHLFVTERDNLALAAHVLVPSPHTAATLAADYGVDPSRITIALPGTDRPLLPPAHAVPPLILSVGLHHPRKGHPVLLRALSRIADLDWQARIVGRVHDRAAFEDHLRLRDALGLAGRVEVGSEVIEGALDALYSAASVFALASEYEGYGMVFAEALVRGLPVVACRAGAIPDTVPPEAGILVPVGDAEAFGRALRRLLAEPDLRTQMAAAARRHGDRLPAWTDTVRIAGGVLDRLAKG